MNYFSKDWIPENPKILLIKLRSIGDVIYNTAVYRPIKKMWPKSQLTVVVESPAYDIVRFHPDVDQVLCFEKGSFVSQCRFYWALFSGGFDLAIDMHEGPRGAIMCFLSFANYRVGNALAKRAFLYSIKLNFSDLNPKFPIEYQTGLISKLGVDVTSANPLVRISDSSRQQARQLLEKQGVRPEDNFCIIHPGARNYDQWQYDKFAQLAMIFRQKLGLKVVLTCGPGQGDQAEEVKAYLKNFTLVFIETGLQELGAITEWAHFVLCHNGGYMHLSAVLGTPVIALFGLSNPAIWRPMGEGHAVLHHKLDCFPCSSKTIRDVCTAGRPECKERITVSEVVEAAERILDRNNTSR